MCTTCVSLTVLDGVSSSLLKAALLLKLFCVLCAAASFLFDIGALSHVFLFYLLSSLRARWRTHRPVSLSFLARTISNDVVEMGEGVGVGRRHSATR